MPPKKDCGCGFGQKNCFGNIDTFFNKLPNPDQCLQNLIYGGASPLTHASGFGQKKGGPMRIGKKNKV